MGRDIDVTWDTNTDDGTLKRKIKKLEDNNKQLRDPLKVAYAEVYKKFMSRTMFTFTACSIRGSDSSLREITFSYSTKAAV